MGMSSFGGLIQIDFVAQLEVMFVLNPFMDNLFKEFMTLGHVQIGKLPP